MPADRSLSFTKIPTSRGDLSNGSAMADPAGPMAAIRDAVRIFHRLSTPASSAAAEHGPILWLERACPRTSADDADTEHGAGGLGTTMVNSLQDILEKLL